MYIYSVSNTPGNLLEIYTKSPGNFLVEFVSLIVVTVLVFQRVSVQNISR